MQYMRNDLYAIWYMIERFGENVSMAFPSGQISATLPCTNSSRCRFSGNRYCREFIHASSRGRLFLGKTSYTKTLACKQQTHPGTDVIKD